MTINYNNEKLHQTKLNNLKAQDHEARPAKVTIYSKNSNTRKWSLTQCYEMQVTNQSNENATFNSIFYGMWNEYIAYATAMPSIKKLRLFHLSRSMFRNTRANLENYCIKKLMSPSKILLKIKHSSNTLHVH